MKEISSFISTMKNDIVDIEVRNMRLVPKMFQYIVLFLLMAFF